MMLHLRFFRECSLVRSHGRLWSLGRAGYLKSIPLSGSSGAVWTLTKQGFAVVCDELPALREHGFESEYPRHDLVCAALQLGDWLSDHPDHVSMFAEQQLRRFETEMNPKWVPTSVTHRPDGYTLIKGLNASRLFALEVELSRKTASAYRAAGIFFANESRIDRAIWIVGREIQIPHLESHLVAFDVCRPSIHNFASAAQFQKSGWSTPIVRGPDSGVTIREIFTSDLPRTKPEQSPNIGSGRPFFDTRKKPLETGF